jgi:hypothetical protein
MLPMLQVLLPVQVLYILTSINHCSREANSLFLLENQGPLEAAGCDPGQGCHFRFCSQSQSGTHN